jgi:endonuclease/exonuclease/phosphatase family metal-dependent hydrolase
MMRSPDPVRVAAALVILGCAAAPPSFAQTSGALRITEIVVTPTAGEFVEILNTGDSTIDLSQVYLTDGTFAGGGTFYYNIVTGDLDAAGGGGFSDWHARFPSGATIAPGEYQTVAMGDGATGFFATYGVLPTYEVCDTDGAVADMEEALAGSINCDANSPGLTNGGEVVIMYQWDGVSDLVGDIDYAVWGDRDEAVDKTGVAIDGPDGDDVASAYLADTPVASQSVVAGGAHGSGDSFTRADLDEGTEVQSGGNGVDGADETSENLADTFCIAAVTPGAAGECPPPPTGELVINEIHADPAGDIAGDANGDGTRDGTQDEFVELVNAGALPLDISDWSIADGFGERHRFASGTVLPAGCGVIVFGGGAPTGTFGDFLVTTASSGALGFNNDGDSVIVSDASGGVVAEVSYGGEGGDDQSLTRDPDLTGAFVQHTVATGAGGALFSPGTRVDGSAFGGCSGPVITLISEIQGAAHRSPLEGQTVTVEAVVTAVADNGFYVQEEDADADGDIATSEGLFVFTGGAPAVIVGDLVQMTDVVEEFRPAEDRVTITEFAFPTVSVVSSGNPLPTPVVLGVDRVQPTQIIDNDSIDTIDIEVEGSFDVDEDGIDFYESLEGMRVQANDLVVSGATTVFGSPTPGNAEVYTLADNGAGAGPRTLNGGIHIRPDDFNPENLILNNALVQLPLEVKAGDLIPGAVVGVISSNFGKYFLLPDAPLPSAVDGGLVPAVTSLTGDAARLTVASFNVENLDPEDGDGDADIGDGRFDAIAAVVVTNLGAPDIIGLQEVQDDSGSLNDGITTGDLTAATLIAAIESAGGPTYAYLEVAPFDLDNGGQPGGNIRTAFLYNPARVQFVPRGNAGAGDAVDAVDGPGVPDLTLSPGLIDPSQFVDSRKPTAAEFRFNGRTVFVVSNHWNSKGGDTSLFDILQPPVLFSETERLVQAAATAGFVTDVLTLDPQANVVVLGDLNDFEFSPPVQLLLDAGLTNLVEAVPADDRYSFVFNGNSQVLDHVLVSDALIAAGAELDMVHVNVDFPETADRAADHDPLVARLNLPPSSIETILYLNDAVLAGDIVGTAPRPELRVALYRRLLAQLQGRLAQGQTAAACAILAAATSLADGGADDFVTGAGTVELQDRLASIGNGLDCAAAR